MDVVTLPPGDEKHQPAILIRDRKSTRLNSSHGYISYAGFWLKKKRKENPCGSEVFVVLLVGEGLQTEVQPAARRFSRESAAIAVTCLLCGSIAEPELPTSAQP